MILSFSYFSLKFILGLNDVVAIVLISDISLGAVWVDADGVGEPPRIAPVCLDEAAGDGVLLQHLGLVLSCRVNPHVLQVACSILVLNRM